MFDIKEQLKQLPDCPGVYLHKDSLGNIIYVGKAVSLRNRVRQYFQSSRHMDPKVRSMVSQIAEFEYIRAGSEVEALILECNLIKKYRPKYNILLRDDKTYPYIKITGEQWPRLIKTRQITKDGGRYFGPYSDAGAVNRIVGFLNSTFALKRCSATVFPPGFRPCLNYHINQCRGICDGKVDPEEYAKAIDGAAAFLKGHSRELIRDLEEKMRAASEAMNYEEAAVYRDHIDAAKALMETQRVVMHHSSEADILIPVRGDEWTYMAVFFVREGKLTGRESYEMDAAEAATLDDKSEPDTPEEKSELETGGEILEARLVAAFIKQHYSRMTDIPSELIVSVLPEDKETLEGFLAAQAEHKVSITAPKRGEKRALMELARKDVQEMAKTIDDRARSRRERKDKLGREIYAVLSEMGEAGEFDGREYRAEAYDISNTNGVDTVGAMVTFSGIKPDKKGYRKFKIRSVEGQDDYGAMKEMLSRRFLRLFKGDAAFSELPDIIFMDGGKGHVSTALEVIDATGFDIPVVGMVKDDNHRTRALIYRVPDPDSIKVPNDPGADGAGDIEAAAGDYREISLKDKPLLYAYIGRMQEEVHRFAIEYHRKVRNRSVQKSVLDEIPGIGEKRRNALLREFGSVDSIKEIALSEDGADRLSGAETVDRRAAENICEYFRRNK